MKLSSLENYYAISTGCCLRDKVIETYSKGTRRSVPTLRYCEPHCLLEVVDDDLVATRKESRGKWMERFYKGTSKTGNIPVCFVTVLVKFQPSNLCTLGIEDRTVSGALFPRS